MENSSILENKIGSKVGSFYSDYRTTLMGVGILGVLIGHFFSLSGIETSNIITKMICNIYILVFTQVFFFLSGFGVFFSYSQKQNTALFYIRRVERVFLPYIVMTLPFFVYLDFFFKPSFLRFLGHISTFGYWYENYLNVFFWYIDVSILLYLIYPIVHQLVFQSDKFWKVSVRMLLVLVFFSLLNLVVFFYFDSYYQNHNLCFEQYIIFFIGVYAGYLYQNHNNKFIYVLLSWFVFTFLIQRLIPELNFLYDPMKKVVIYMPIICIFFNLLSNIHVVKIIKKILDWMGTYSLELYILHSVVYGTLVMSKMQSLNSSISITIAVILSVIFCKPTHILVSQIVKRIIKK